MDYSLAQCLASASWLRRTCAPSCWNDSPAGLKLATKHPADITRGLHACRYAFELSLWSTSLQQRTHTQPKQPPAHMDQPEASLPQRTFMSPTVSVSADTSTSSSCPLSASCSGRSGHSTRTWCGHQFYVDLKALKVDQKPQPQVEGRQWPSSQGVSVPGVDRQPCLTKRGQDHFEQAAQVCMCCSSNIGSQAFCLSTWLGTHGMGPAGRMKCNRPISGCAHLGLARVRVQELLLGLQHKVHARALRLGLSCARRGETLRINA